MRKNRTKLTMEIVRAVKDELKAGRTWADIATARGVGRSTIAKISNMTGPECAHLARKENPKLGRGPRKRRPDVAVANKALRAANVGGPARTYLVLVGEKPAVYRTLEEALRVVTRHQLEGRYVRLFRQLEYVLTATITED